jgi:hypothetical protein
MPRRTVRAARDRCAPPTATSQSPQLRIPDRCSRTRAAGGPAAVPVDGSLLIGSHAGLLERLRPSGLRRRERAVLLTALPSLRRPAFLLRPDDPEPVRYLLALAAPPRLAIRGQAARVQVLPGADAPPALLEHLTGLLLDAWNGLELPGPPPGRLSPLVVGHRRPAAGMVTVLLFRPGDRSPSVVAKLPRYGPMGPPLRREATALDAVWAAPARHGAQGHPPAARPPPGRRHRGAAADGRARVPPVWHHGERAAAPGDARPPGRSRARLVRRSAVGVRPVGRHRRLAARPTSSSRPRRRPSPCSTATPRSGRCSIASSRRPARCAARGCPWWPATATSGRATCSSRMDACPAWSTGSGRLPTICRRGTRSRRSARPPTTWTATARCLAAARPPSPDGGPRAVARLAEPQFAAGFRAAFVQPGWLANLCRDALVTSFRRTGVPLGWRRSRHCCAHRSGRAHT